MISKLQNPWRNFVRRTSRVMRSVLHSDDIRSFCRGSVLETQTEDPWICGQEKGTERSARGQALPGGPSGPARTDLRALSLMNGYRTQGPSLAQPNAGSAWAMGWAWGRQNPLHLSHPTPPITTSPSGPPCRARLYLVLPLF